MLTKSVKSVISVVLKHVARAKKSVLSVRSVSIISEWVHWTTILFSRVRISFLSISDAGRVAPISACVWCLRFLQHVSDYLKCDKIGLAFDANFERTRLYGLRGHAQGGDIDGLLHKKKW